MAARGFWDWVVYIINKYGEWFVRGAGTTLAIALSGTVIGFTIGLMIGVIRTIPGPRGAKRRGVRRYLLSAVNFLLSCYIEVFRGTPMIVQAMVIYYGLAEGFGIDIPNFTAGIIIVSINTGAYMAEIVRGGIQSIDKGQTEAAHAIGMSHAQTMINVVLPQAIRNILPATGNEFVINIKDTSVLNVISVTELFFMTKSVKGAIFRTYEVFFVAGAIYLLLTFTFTRLLRMVEKRLDGPEGYTIYGSSSMSDSQIKIRGVR